jgi:hypothetical protein
MKGSSLLVFSLIVVLAILSSALVISVGTARDSVTRLDTRLRQERMLESTCLSMLGILDNDDGIDSRADIDRCLAQVPGESGVEIEDVSSMINEKWLDKPLSSSIESKGYTTILAKTQFGYANAYTVEKAALIELALARTSSLSFSEDFADSIIKMRADGTISNDDIKRAAGDHASLMLPVLKTDPQYNVNFIDEKLLEAILSIMQLKLPQPDELSRSIIAKRERGDVDIYDLAAILSVNQDHPVLKRLGCVTSFWKITSTNKKYSWTIVASNEGNKYRIVESEGRIL